MNMNKLFLLVGLLSAGVAVGQTKTQTTKTSSATTSSSNYNNSNTNNYNSQNATSGTNSSTNGGTGSMSTGSTTPSTTGSTYNTSMGSTTQASGTGDMSTGTTGNTTNGTYNNSTSLTPSSTGNANTTTDGNGATTTTPSTGGNYNSTGSTSNTTYSTAKTTDAYPREKKDYKNFTYAIYAGANTTRFKGESFDANGAASGLTGRLGYQLGFFVRGGGRLYGQIGAEYFASSSNYFTTAPGSGTTTATSIRDRIDIKYIQVPVYIGYKLTQSDRGISAVRVQVGLEYANQIGSTANQFGSLNNFQLKSGTFNGLGQLGFDAGPVFLDLTYHYCFSNTIEQNTGFAGSQRRILSASVGFKF